MAVLCLTIRRTAVKKLAMIALKLIMTPYFTTIISCLLLSIHICFMFDLQQQKLPRLQSCCNDTFQAYKAVRLFPPFSHKNPAESYRGLKGIKNSPWQFG